MDGHSASKRATPRRAATIHQESPPTDLLSPPRALSDDTIGIVKFDLSKTSSPNNNQLIARANRPRHKSVEFSNSLLSNELEKEGSASKLNEENVGDQTKKKRSSKKVQKVLAARAYKSIKKKKRNKRYQKRQRYR